FLGIFFPPQSMILSKQISVSIITFWKLNSALPVYLYPSFLYKDAAGIFPSYVSRRIVLHLSSLASFSANVTNCFPKFFPAFSGGIHKVCITRTSLPSASTDQLIFEYSGGWI